MSGSDLALKVLAKTPVWVWALLAFLVWQGVRRLRPGVSALERIALVPVAFITWGLVGLAQQPWPLLARLGIWSAGAALGGLLSLASAPGARAVDRRRRLVALPGSPAALVRNLVIFGLHYGLRVAAALYPRHSAVLIPMDIAVSGASAGYFAGWGALLLRDYARSPEPQAARRAEEA